MLLRLYIHFMSFMLYVVFSFLNLTSSLHSHHIGMFLSIAQHSVSSNVSMPQPFLSSDGKHLNQIGFSVFPLSGLP